MAPRAGDRRERDYDFADVGVKGRRTGVTVEHRPLDDFGFEQVSSFFSSPTKPSPAKRTSPRTSGQTNAQATPKPSTSSRKSIRGTSAPPPRSASPRKSGISGTAKRRNIVDKFDETDENQVQQEHDPAKENQPPPTHQEATILPPNKGGAATVPRRFSPEKSPLRSQTSGKVRTAHVERQPASAYTLSNHSRFELDVSRNAQEQASSIERNELDDGPRTSIEHHNDPADECQFANDNVSDEEEYPVTNVSSPSKPQSREPTQANSRKKRRADALEEQTEPESVSSPAVKRAKRRNDEENDKRRDVESAKNSESVKPAPRETAKNKPAAQPKPSNLNLSKHQEQELDRIVETVRARTGQQKSLYILHRETPVNDSVTHTRSGRVSVKPLAYWRNERCIYGGSPGGASIADGARFPLNSIKEIIRTEHVDTQDSKQKKKRRKVTKAKAGSRAASETADRQVSEDEAEEFVDPDAEPWETDYGTLRGQISVWDPEQQKPVEQEEEIDIAYASGAIETKEVKGSSFRYAKLLTTSFFSTGIVDLPPGAIKRPKNSRKMHMSFFVASGRVTVEVGPINGPESRFSIGKGGFWQVPRGNQYSIHNEQERQARIYFSQACEPVPQLEED